MGYEVRYTLPGERGKIRMAKFTKKEDRDKKIAAIKAKGGNIKGTSSY